MTHSARLLNFNWYTFSEVKWIIVPLPPCSKGTSMLKNLLLSMNITLINASFFWKIMTPIIAILLSCVFLSWDLTTYLTSLLKEFYGGEKWKSFHLSQKLWADWKNWVCYYKDTHCTWFDEYLKVLSQAKCL